jgi:hypothetical protein
MNALVHYDHRQEPFAMFTSLAIVGVTVLTLIGSVLAG